VSGKLIVIAGPSGVGKGTLISRLLQSDPSYQLSVSATTREPRAGEIDGKHYRFLSDNEFNQKVAAGDFLEWAEFSHHKYGTLKSEVSAILEAGKHVILEIELAGVRQVKQIAPEAIAIFVIPPDLAQLKERLIARGSEPTDQIESRLKIAETEISARNEFDWVLVNDELEASFTQLLKYLKSVTE
jgi:guanylate kinase